MTSLRRVSRNTAFSSASEIANKLLTLGFYVFMARALGREGFGDFVFSLSLGLLLTEFAGFGTDAILTREVARRRHRLGELFWNVVGVKLALGALAVGLALAVAMLGGYGTEVRIAVVLLAIASVVSLVGRTVGATLQAFDDLKPSAVALFIQRLVTAVIGIAALAAGAGVAEVAAIYLAGAVAALAYFNREIVARRLRPRVEVSREQARWLIATSLPIGLTAIFSTMVFRLDATILSLFKGNAAVGLYGAAYQLLETPLFLAYGFVAAIVPTLARLRRDTHPSIAEAYEGACKVIVSLFLPIGMGFVLFSEPLMRLIYGPGYIDAASAVRLLGAAVALYGLSYLAGYVLISQDRQRIILWIAAAVALENVTLNLLLIPMYSFNGAAAVTSLSEATLAVLLTGLALRATGAISLSRIALGPAIACCGMALVALGLGTNLAGLVVAVVSYPIVLVVVERRLFPADLRLALESIRRERALT
jgi:O-antigen/teichoic acid export membrane protein